MLPWTVNLARPELTEEFSDLLVKGFYNDGSVKEYKCHKVIVSLQSTWFASACRKGTFMEGESGVITIPLSKKPESDDDTDDGNIFHCMMSFFYSQNYLSSLDEIRGEDNLPKHAMVYAIAEKYGVAGLMELAQKHYVRRIGSLWTHTDMARAISITNNSVAASTEGLKQFTAVAVARHMDRLIEDPEICSALELAPEFMIRVMKTLKGMKKLVAFCDKHEKPKPCDPCANALQAKFMQEHVDRDASRRQSRSMIPRGAG